MDTTLRLASRRTRSSSPLISLRRKSSCNFSTKRYSEALLPKRSMRLILKGKLTDEFSWPLGNSHAGSTRCGEGLNKVADLVH